MAEKHVPRNKEDWLTLRRRFLGSSAIGCLVDRDHPYETPFGLWAKKTGKLPDDDIDSAVLRRGRKLEKLGAEETAERLPGVKIEHNTANAYWCDQTLRIGATPDIIAHDPERGLGVVEIKCPEPSIYAKTWAHGEPPLSFVLQTLTAARLVDAQWAAIGALRVGFGYDFDLIDIPIHSPRYVSAWSRLTQAAGEFWRCVETDTPPQPNYKRDLAVISAMYPMDDGTAIDLSHDNELMSALADREEFKKLEKELEDQVKRTDALIRDKAGLHELIIAGDYRCVLKTQQISGYVVKPRVQRSLRIKKIREASA